MTKEMKKMHEVLAAGLNGLDTRKESKIAVALSMQTENQMLTMFDWLQKHMDSNPSEDEVIEIAKAIAEQVE